MVPKGNPKGITSADRPVRQDGLHPERRASWRSRLNARSTACTDAGKPAINIQGYAKVADEFQQIVLGRVDADLGDGHGGRRLDDHEPGQVRGRLLAASQDDLRDLLHQGQRRSRGALAAALAALKDDGTLAAIATKYNIDPATLDAIQ